MPSELLQVTLPGKAGFVWGVPRRTRERGAALLPAWPSIVCEPSALVPQTPLGRSDIAAVDLSPTLSAKAVAAKAAMINVLLYMVIITTEQRKGFSKERGGERARRDCDGQVATVCGPSVCVEVREWNEWKMLLM